MSMLCMAVTLIRRPELEISFIILPKIKEKCEGDHLGVAKPEGLPHTPPFLGTPKTKEQVPGLPLKTREEVPGF